MEQLRCKHAILGSIVGKTDVEVFPESSAMEYVKNDKMVIATQKGICIEEEVLLPNEQKLVQLSFKEPLYDDSSSELMGVLGYTIDITETRSKEEELRREKERRVKHVFLANMCHDFRTPFSGILGMVQVMISEEDDPNKKEMLNVITESAKILLNDLNEIFEYLELQNGLPVLMKQFNLAETLNEVFATFLPAAEASGIQLLVKTDTNLPQYLIGDRFRTKRILEDLISNALKFTKCGKVTLDAELAKDVGNKIIVKFTVRDTGIGMPEDAYNIIFEPLSRLHPSYEGVYKGKGLGLRLVKTFLDEIEGEAHVNSELEKGSVFKLLIPYKKTLLNCSEKDL